MDSTQQESQVPGASRLSRGIASPGNFVLLLATFALFPIIGRWTHAFGFGSIPLNGPQHTRALVKFFLFLMAFEWLWFLIAWAGIRSYGKATFAQVVGGNWNRPSSFLLL